MMTIPLDPRFTAAQNAQRYFKKYGKFRTAIVEKGVQLQETEQEIIYLESVLNFIDSAETLDDLEDIRAELIENGFLKKKNVRERDRKLKLRPYEYHTSSGKRILVGRNNRENDILTFKTAGSRDIWMHTKDIPGSHVILFTEGEEPSETDIFETAALAAWHSKAKLSGQVPVDYMRVKYVKKPNGAKPGYVIFTNNSTVYVTPYDPKKEEK
jgi:predicted ribosome quality control (RQC) complex YloA/Tae2 family protein